MSLRKLKYHEQKLLKKVDFLSYKKADNLREAHVIRKYMLQNREDYPKYNRLCGEITKMTNKLKKMDPKDPLRIELTDKLLEKLYNMGVIQSKKSLALCDRISVSSFCRRRLPVVMVRLNMSENLKEAITFVEQGHIRVGPHVVTDAAFLVTRNMEDYVTWVDTSKIKRKIMKYNEKLDDFDLLGL